MSNFFEEVLFANVFNLPNDLQAGHKYFNELFVITFTKFFSMFKTVSKFWPLALRKIEVKASSWSYNISFWVFFQQIDLPLSVFNFYFSFSTFQSSKSVGFRFHRVEIMILLSLRFYVKSILRMLEVQKLPFLPF